MTAVAQLDPWHCPDGKLILPPELEHTDEWFEIRRTGITATELAQIKGESPWADSTAYAVWQDKKWGVQKARNEAMHWGQKLELPIAEMFAERQGLEFRKPGTWQSLIYPHALANPDLLTDDGGGGEVKTSRYGKGWEDKGIPLHYRRQVEHCLLVTGRTHWWVACLIGGNDLQIRCVERDEAQLREHGELIEAWWAKHMVGDEPPEWGAPLPPVNPLSATEALIPEAVLADVARGLELSEQVSVGKAELDAIKARLAMQFGDSKFLTVNQVPVAVMRERKGKNGTTRYVTLIGGTDD